MESFYNCKICNKQLNLKALSSHSKKHKLTPKEYYDLYHKKLNEEFCLICNNPTKYVRFSIGYSKVCSKKCSSVLNNNRLFELTGYKNQFQVPENKDKIKITNLEKYGVENASQNQVIKQKKIDTAFKHYGVKHSTQAKEVKEQIKITNLEKYGSENVMGNKAIAEKAALNGGGRAKAKKYKTKFGNEIIIQGSYERKFVNYCEENNIKIQNGPSIHYLYNDKKHRYYVDFLIILPNDVKKIVEIKSTYWYEKYKDIVDTKNIYANQYAQNNNLEFIFIINNSKERKLNLDSFKHIL